MVADMVWTLTWSIIFFKDRIGFYKNKLNVSMIDLFHSLIERFKDLIDAASGAIGSFKSKEKIIHCVSCKVRVEPEVWCGQATLSY